MFSGCLFKRARVPQFSTMRGEVGGVGSAPPHGFFEETGPGRSEPDCGSGLGRLFPLTVVWLVLQKKKTCFLCCSSKLMSASLAGTLSAWRELSSVVSGPLGGAVWFIISKGLSKTDSKSNAVRSQTAFALISFPSFSAPPLPPDIRICLVTGNCVASTCRSWGQEVESRSDTFDSLK